MKEMSDSSKKKKKYHLDNIKNLEKLTAFQKSQSFEKQGNF